MLYLISQYWLWLLLAFALGLVVGWLSWGGDWRGWSWVPLGLAVALLLFVLSWFRVINGTLALWVETGILAFFAYLVGCWLGGRMKGAFALPAAAPLAAAAVAAPAAALAPVAASPPAGPAQQAEVTKPAAEAAPAQPAAPALAARIEGEENIPGQRPPGLAAPRDGKADDLKWIKGIGRQNEGRLHGLGIWHFDQVAAWTRENVEWVGSYLAFPGRIDREQWVKQAGDLAAGKETEFAKRAKWGLVATSRDDGSLGQGNVEALEPGARPANAGKGTAKSDKKKG